MSGNTSRRSPQLFMINGDSDRIIGVSRDPIFVEILQALPGYDDLADRAERAFSQTVSFEPPFDGADPVGLILDGKITMQEVLDSRQQSRRDAERGEDQLDLVRRLTSAVDGEARRWYAQHEKAVIAELTKRLRGIADRGRKIVSKGLQGVTSWTDVEKHPDAAGPWAEFAATVGPEFGTVLALTRQLTRPPSSWDSSTGLPVKVWPLTEVVTANEYASHLWPAFWQRSGDVTAPAVPWFEGCTATEVLRGVIDRNVELTACTWRERIERDRELQAKAETQISREIEKLDNENTVRLSY